MINGQTLRNPRSEMTEEIDTSKFVPLNQCPAGHTPVVLVACGSFSPITYMHLRMFEMARDELRLGVGCPRHPRLFVVGGLLSPVSDAYNKPDLAPADHRIAMCRLAVASSDWITVDAWEARQAQYQTTLRVLTSVEQRLRDFYGEVRVMFLAGADLIRSFDVPGMWSPDDLNRILSHHGCIAIDRWQSDLSEYLLENPILYAHRSQITVVRQYISNDISSTRIRLLLRRAFSVKYLLPDEVIGYIKKHGLYQTDLDGKSE